MSKIIVGYTGVVGQTLVDNIKFDYFFNSSNIDEFEYSICGIYEIEKRYCEEIKHLLPMLPCKNL